MTARTRATMAIAMAGLLALAACGDDDEAADTGSDVETTTTASADGGGTGADSEYCVLAAELDQQQDFPTADQLEAIRAVAPEEIRAEIDLVVDRFLEAIEAGDPASAFADPAIEESFGPIEAYEADVCGLENEEEEAEQDPSVTQLDPAAARVDVTATEYAFELATPSAGRTSFVMTNAGEESHVMLVAKLREGATLEQAMAGDPEEFVAEEYESDVAAPGGEAVATVELTPGDWALVCYLPDASGEPHFNLGMATPFTVA